MFGYDGEVMLDACESYRVAEANWDMGIPWSGGGGEVYPPCWKGIGVCDGGGGLEKPT